MKRLDINETPKVTYAIPLWLRDEQVKLSTARIKGRIEPAALMQSEPIAVVGFGPSLNQTWEKVREFKHVISCSGSHRFLIDRGIVPNYHVEVDPRAHKVKLLGEPHPDVCYLPSSTCHPEYFDHLEGFNVKLWHVFDNDRESQRLLGANEWALTGGCDVGLRALVIARFFGFTDIHVFGMDGCYGETGRHAAEHPYQLKGSEVEFQGKVYMTTPGMLAAAKSIEHELDELSDCTFTFYGEGLVQALAAARVPKEKTTPIYMGMAKPELISDEYRQLNERLHKENLAYGVGGEKHLDTVLKLAASIKTKNVLDYGCGKGRLGRAMPYAIAEYDPAVGGKMESPKPADLVVCTDVLEHIEPDKLGPVLADLQRCVRKIGFFVVHCGASSKTLADGRNTHLIQQPPEWWAEKLRMFFAVPDNGVIVKPPLVYFVVGPKQRKMVEAVSAEMETANA